MHKAMFWTNSRLIGGVLTLAIGGFVLVESSGYARGSLLRMGPGFFPTLLGCLLLLLGVLQCLGGLRGTAEQVEHPEIRAPACIGLGLILFALVLPRFGLVPAIALLVPIAACASPSSRVVPTLVMTVLLIGFAWLVFVKLLSLPFVMLSW